MEIIGSMSSEGLNLVWEKNEKGHDIITLYTDKQKDDEEPEKLKSMTYKGKN